jgi:hypothetical protein
MDWNTTKLQAGAAISKLRRRLESYAEKKDHNKEYLSEQASNLRDLEHFYFTVEAAMRQLEEERAAAYIAGMQKERERQSKKPSQYTEREESIRLLGREGYRDLANSQAKAKWDDHFSPWQPNGKKYKLDKQGNLIEM